jgi:hypothetical protein
MEEKMLRRTVLQLRFIGLLLVLLFLFVVLTSAKTSKLVDDFWSQLGISEKEGASNIQESFMLGFLQHAGARNIRNIAQGDRAAVTKDLLAFTKTYVQSEAFKKAYELERKKRMPSEPKQPRTEAEIRKEGIESNERGLANLDKTLKNANEETRKIIKPTYEMLQKQVAEYKDPNSNTVKLVMLGDARQYEARLKEYQAAHEQWQHHFPANSNLFVKRRLLQVLEATQDVDHKAALVERNGKKYFVRADYEKKSSNWKAAFRAGPEVTETVRSFVRQWLTEL